MYARLLTLALCLAAASAQKTKKKDCVSGVHVIAVRGHGNSMPPYGLSTTTVNNITAAIPDSDVVPVKYPATLDDIYEAAQKGAAKTKVYIRHYANSCPDTKIVVQGYSQGAMAVMAALCGSELPNQPATPPLPDKFANNVIAVVLYGDESRNGDAPYNEGTCTNAGPPRSSRTTWECGAYTDMIQSWCDSTDPACCVGGNNMNSHYAYPNKYDAVLTEYVEEQYDNST